jgi:hypothetical protein
VLVLSGAVFRSRPFIYKRGGMNTGVIWQRANSKLVIDFCKGCDRILFNDPLARFENCDDCQREITLAVMEASAR